MEWGGSIKADKGRCPECGVKGWIQGAGSSLEKLFAFSICPNGCMQSWRRDLQTQAAQGLLEIKCMKNPTLMLFIVLFYCVRAWLAWQGDIVFRRCNAVNPHCGTGARNLRNLFSKLLILQNNQTATGKTVPEPPLNNDGIVHLEKKTGVGFCIYQFSLSLFAHHLFVVAWRRPILGPAGCPVRMASPKISSSQRWPFLQLCHCGCLWIQRNSFVSLAFFF